LGKQASSSRSGLEAPRRKEEEKLALGIPVLEEHLALAVAACPRRTVRRLRYPERALIPPNRRNQDSLHRTPNSVEGFFLEKLTRFAWKT
jgi:hypothetical protein